MTLTYLEALVFIAILAALPKRAPREFQYALTRVDFWMACCLRDDAVQAKFVERMTAVMADVELWRLEVADG